MGKERKKRMKKIKKETKKEWEIKSRGEDKE
jgi:hypothetical protein